MNSVVLCLRFISCAALLSAGLASTQTLTKGTDLAADRPGTAVRTIPKPIPNPAVAYLYVSQRTGENLPFQVTAYVVHANGLLTSVVGSPFQADAGSIAVNGKYLFGTSVDNANINTYAIEPGGGLTYITSSNVEQISGRPYGYSGDLTLDHTGSTLYMIREMGYDGVNSVLDSLAINKKTGALTMTQGYRAVPMQTNNYGWYSWFNPLAISADNQYVYQIGPMFPETSFGKGVTVQKRESTGTLVSTWPGKRPVPIPSAPLSTGSYPNIFYPIFLATDPFNNIAAVFQECRSTDGDDIGVCEMSPAFGVYTPAAEGNLKTASTYNNMAYDGSSDSMMAIRMSPSGKILAISYWDDTGGIALIHSNGGQQPTRYGVRLLPPDYTDYHYFIEDLDWDNNDHLFAIDVVNNLLYVFTVTPTSYSQAPGSPYSIANAERMRVQPLPLP